MTVKNEKHSQRKLFFFLNITNPKEKAFNKG
jgi:hypothetical protein